MKYLKLSRTNCLAILCSAIWLNGYAVPYQSFNVDDIFTMNEADNGSHTAEFSMQSLEQAVNQLWIHANNYPLHFDTTAERGIAEKDIKKLRILAPFIREKVLSNMNDTQAVEHIKALEARLAVMAYNFDDVEALHVADTLYEELIEETQDEALKALYQQDYGQFLGMSARGDQAKPYLEAALKSGRKQALRPLGLLEIMHYEDRDKALQYLSQYLEFAPEDEAIQTLVKKLSDPDVEINKKVM